MGASLDEGCDRLIQYYSCLNLLSKSFDGNGLGATIEEPHRCDVGCQSCERAVEGEERKTTSRSTFDKGAADD